MKTSSLLKKLVGLRGAMATAAQEVYDGWMAEDGEEFDPTYGGGGICDSVANEMGNVLASAGIDQTDGGQDGDDHAFLIAYDETHAYVVDIPPGVYERGSGYSWKKIEGVTIEANDVVIEEFPRDQLEVENDWSENPILSYAEDKKRIIEFVDSLGDPLTLYRGVVLESPDGFIKSDPGVSWTWEKSFAYSPFGAIDGRKGKMYIVTAKAPRSAVDEFQTVARLRRYEEKEITLIPGSKIEIISIEPRAQTYKNPPLTPREKLDAVDVEYDALMKEYHEKLRPHFAGDDTPQWVQDRVEATEDRRAALFDLQWELRKQLKLDPRTGKPKVKSPPIETVDEGYFPALLGPIDELSECRRTANTVLIKTGSSDIIHESCRAGSFHLIRRIVDGTPVSGLTLRAGKVWKGLRSAVIDTVFTDESARRRGYAADCLDYARSYFRKVEHSKTLTAMGRDWKKTVKNPPWIYVRLDQARADSRIWSATGRKPVKFWAVGVRNPVYRVTEAEWEKIKRVIPAATRPKNINEAHMFPYEEKP